MRSTSIGLASPLNLPLPGVRKIVMAYGARAALRRKKGAVALMLWGLFSASASASILGKEAQIGHRFIDRFDFMASTTVTDTDSDKVLVLHGYELGYHVDLNSNSLHVQFYNPAAVRTYYNVTGPNMNGLYISSPHLNARELVESATLEATNFFSLPRIRMIDEHSVGFDFQGTDAHAHYYFKLRFAQTLEVGIDVAPNNPHNVIAPNSAGIVQVALLSSPSFDATAINQDTVRFGPEGKEASATGFRVNDVNGDGVSDMILSFQVPNTGIGCGAETAVLTGKTQGGQSFKGSDRISTPGCSTR